MKILILTMNVGRTAPGIVFEKLIRGLSKYHEIDVITVDNQPSEVLRAEVCSIKYLNLHPRIKKMLIGVFGFNFFDLLWGYKVLKLLKNRDKQYDVVFSFMSYHHYASLITNQLVFKSNLFKSAKYYVYCVDAVPAPLGWNKNDFYFRGCKILMRKFTRHIDGFFSSNEKMLHYQLSLLDLKRKIVSDVIYTPTQNENLNFPLLDDIIFLYTGGVYGPRKVCYLFEAFKKLRVLYPCAKLRFVGTFIPESQLQILDEDDLCNVEFFPFTRDLHKHYEESIALIDIDCDLDNDVFISSKVINYLSVNRIIISETCNDSPSYNLFKNIDSVYVTDHNPKNIFNSMIKIIEKSENIDFDDREKILDLFNIDKIVRGICVKYLNV